MGDYMSLHFKFSGRHNPAEVAASLFPGTFFVPIAVGGIALRDSKFRHNWFLAGHAVEDFVSRFLSRQDPSLVGSVKIYDRSGERAELEMKQAPAAENNADSDRRMRVAQGDYLQSVAERISRGDILPTELSPYERNDPLACVTYLKNARLDARVLDALAQWFEEYPSGVCYIYGSLDVAVREKEYLPWTRAFRWYYPPHYNASNPPTPIIIFHVRRSPFATDCISATLYTQSYVWLQNPGSQGFNRLVGKQEADENLARLASLAQEVASSTKIIPDVDLDLEGRTFHHTSKRLRLAFRAVLTNGNEI